ncbi:hypothetical protein F5X98DRAFT_383754 [Xylaria grammica]|nr:hypothetical protein F5X98DRAFT_383754 [Xylaria grammica]
MQLENQLREAKIQLQDAKNHAREAANDAREAAKVRQRIEEARQRADRIKEHTRRTSLDEYIAACHELVFSQFKVETNKSLTSRGSITNPRDKLCPTSLKPWSDFLQQQSRIFGELYATCSPERRVFESRGFLAGLGTRVAQRPIQNEKALEYFLHIAVEDSVTAIMGDLKKVDEFREAFDVGNGIIFENHPNGISDGAEEVVARETTPSHPQTTNHRLRPNQMCVYRSDEEPARRTMIYVSEYKAPHKLTAPHLRQGLRSIDIYKEVVNRKTIPTTADPEGRFQYHAERLTAAALTQTYHYMILGGLEYGLLTTGEATVFLKVDWEAPDTLYYHLAEPASEAAAHPQHLASCAAVGQYLAFGLVALGSPGQRREHRQDERERVKRGLQTWTEDFESILRSIPADERGAPESFSSYAPTTYSTVDRSPVATHKKKRRPRPDENPAQTVRRSQRILAQQPRDEGQGQRRQHCTQKCLLGLVNGGFLDTRCPNVASHRKGTGPLSASSAARLRHPVSHAEWLRLLSQQLAESLDDGVDRLGVQGARGAVFRVTLREYGYTFVSKGTVRAFVRDLEHEAAVYARLRPAQGVHVPVFLGSLDLRSVGRTYYYDHRVEIIHMTFLSWGGHSLADGPEIKECEKAPLEAGLARALAAIHREGVVHEDVRAPNVLRDSETGAVMVIDFERASLLERPQRPRRPLGPVEPNKRARGQEEGKKGAGGAGKRRRDVGFANDRAMAALVFYE